MSILNAGSLNAYVQKYQSNSTYLLIVQADDGVNTQTNVVLKYTDSYHQDSQYWKNLTIYISIFASEPPRYNSPLPSVSISACDWKIATLPIATDPDGDLFSVNLDQDTPDWIKLISSETIQLCPSNVNISKEMTSKIIKIILLDSTNSSTINNFTLNIDTSMLIEMKNISDIELYYSQIYSFNSDIVNSRDIKLIDCLNLQPVSWSSYNSSSNIITINSYNPNLVGEYCVKLSAIDGCGDANLSNNFNISIKLKNPPVFLENLIPITLMKGEKRLFNYR